MQKTIYIPIDLAIINTVESSKLVKRGDTLTLQIKVFNNGVLADLTGQSVDLILKKSDSTLIEKTITSISNGIITATLDVQATNVAGLVNGEIQIYTNNTLASTNTFTFNVDSSLADDVLEASANEIEVLSDLKNTITAGNTAINQYKTNVEAISGSAGAVEALANIKIYIDSNLNDLESENAKAVVNITNETTQNTQAIKNIADLTLVNNTASTLKSGLESDITEGNTLKSTLEVDISTGNILKTNLENAISSGNTTKTNLDTSNSTAQATKTALDTSNTNAQATKTALETDIATAQNSQFATEITNSRGTYANVKARLDASDSSKANLASPTFTGTPTSTTASADTNTTQIATTAFVLGQASSTTPVMDGTATIGSSYKYARADHVHASDTTKANLASPSFTGTPTIGGYNVARAMSGGYLMQSGQTNIVVTTAGSGVGLAITFSTAFPNGCDCVLPVIITTSAGFSGYVNLTANSASKTGFTLGANSYIAQTIAVQWIAFGH